MYIGVDVGGTKLEAALIEKSNQHFKILSKNRTPTERDKGYEHIVAKIADLIKATAGDNWKNISAIGLGLPGSIDPRTQIMILGNTHALEHKPISDDLKKLLNSDVPLFLENDANCFALAETYLGAGLEFEKQTGIPPQQQTVVGVILGTGVGGGIIVNGNIVGGRRGSGGEIGHTTLHENGIDCYCDRKGCAEQYLCGPSVEKKYFNQTGIKTTCSQIFPTAEGKEILKTYQADLGLFLGNLANVMDPDYFVLGGGVSRQPSIYENLSDKIIKNLFVKENPPQVFQHRVSDSSGSLGAAMVAYKKM